MLLVAKNASARSCGGGLLMCSHSDWALQQLQGFFWTLHVTCPWNRPFKPQYYSFGSCLFGQKKLQWIVIFFFFASPCNVFWKKKKHLESFRHLQLFPNCFSSCSEQTPACLLHKAALPDWGSRLKGRWLRWPMRGTALRTEMGTLPVNKQTKNKVWLVWQISPANMFNDRFIILHKGKNMADVVRVKLLFIKILHTYWLGIPD